MTVEEKILDAGYEDVVIFHNEDYDTAFVGVSEDNRAVYDFNLMIKDLVDKYSITEEEAIEWIEYNTLRALPYMGEKAPIVLYTIEN